MSGIPADPPQEGTFTTGLLLGGILGLIGLLIALYIDTDEIKRGALYGLLAQVGLAMLAAGGVILELW